MKTDGKWMTVEQYLDALDLRRLEDDREILDMEGYTDSNDSDASD